jgi:hypothetical protein
VLDQEQPVLNKKGTCYSTIKRLLNKTNLPCTSNSKCIEGKADSEQGTAVAEQGTTVAEQGTAGAEQRTVRAEQGFVGTLG